MFLYVLVCAFIVCVIGIMWCLYILKFAPRLSVKIKMLKLHSQDFIKNICNNGDLLFLSGTSFGEQAIKWYTGSYFSHVAFLFRENDVLYVWEADIGQNRKSGARVTKIEDKLSNWKGEKFGVVKRWLGKRPRLNSILNIIGELFNKKMDKTMITWFFADYTTVSSSFRKNNRAFCSEMIATTLQKLDMVTLKHSANYYSPASFFNDEVKYHKGCYGVPFYFKF